MTPIRSQATHKDLEFCVKKAVYEDGIMVIRYQCALCYGSVSRKSDFPRHMRQHTREELIICPVPECEHPGFTQLGNWRTHYSSVHERKRHVCPHSWVDADGKVSACEHNYSDGSGLIRHRSLHHGFEAGDDVAKIQIPTLKGTKFPNSKYARGNKRKADGDDLLAPPRSVKRAKRTPASSSSCRSSKKSRSASAKPSPVREQQIDWNSLYTLPAASPSEAGPSTVSGWEFGFGCPTDSQLPMQPQPVSGVGSADPLAEALALLATTPTQSGNIEGLLNLEPQTAIVNKWTFGPQTTDFDFNFDFDPVIAPLSLPACNGTIDPSMFMIPAPTMTPTVEQANLANAGLASPPKFYHPGWGSHSPESSRESTASPDYGMFNAQWIPSQSEPVFNGYYGL